MSRKISHSLVSGRAGAGTGGQGLKIEWGSSEDGQLHWMDVDESSLVPVWYGGRGVFMQNSNGNTYGKDLIQYITISTPGNATDFGNIIMVQSEGQGGNCCSNGSRGVLFGGGYPSIIEIQYITVSTPGNATDFGDMLGRNYNGGALSDGLRGVHGGGDGIDTTQDVIEYITIDTTGNSTDFGDLLDVAGAGLAGICNGTRGLFAGKISSGSDYGIQYITVATTGDATDFGDLTVGRYSISGVDDATRGVFSAGRAAGYVNTMDYITMASTGNATDFGDLDRAVKSIAAADDHSRGIFAGGHSGSDEISYITIQTTGNSTDFGNCLENTAADGLSGD